MRLRDAESSILAMLKYDTCRYLIETLKLPTRTNDAHVPDTGHLGQTFTSSFPAYLLRAPVVVVFSAISTSSRKIPKLTEFATKKYVSAKQVNTNQAQGEDLNSWPAAASLYTG